MQAAELRFIELGVALRMALNVLREPFTEFIMGVEETGHNEMKKGP